MLKKQKVRGTADAYGGVYLSILQLPRTHSRLLIIRGLRTDGQGRTGRVIENADAVLRTIFRAVCGEGGGVHRGPRATTYSAPSTNYHRLGWSSTDRPRPINDVKGRRKVQLRSGI